MSSTPINTKLSEAIQRQTGRKYCRTGAHYMLIEGGKIIRDARGKGHFVCAECAKHKGPRR
jgi:hypothetical protein